MEELRRNEDMVCLNETVFDGQAEQGVELDHVLPDYFPEIFRILSCRLTPKIMSYSMAGDNKLMLDGKVEIKVMYLAENSSELHCIEQNYTYTKTVDLGKSHIPADSNVTVKLSSKPDYCNCRAVSGRRIDIRGAVSTKISICAVKSCTMPVIPKNVQVKTKEITCCGNVKCTEKQFSIREEIETGAGGLGFIVRSTASPKVTDIRVIADKAVIKGVVTVTAAYGLHDSELQGCRTIERMSADIPVSQIIDIDGIDESFISSASLDILSCELNCSSDSGIIGCNILAVCRVSCHKEAVVKLPCDAFSTEYEVDLTLRRIKLMQNCRSIERQLNVRSSCSYDGGEIESVLDCTAEVFNMNCTRNDDGGLTLAGLICCQALCRSSDGLPCHIEKQEGFECSIPADDIPQDAVIKFNANCTEADCTIRSDGTLDITAELSFNAEICGSVTADLAENITVIEDKPKHSDTNYALRIYYADGTESCWNIAKKYSTSVEAIMTENEIEDGDMPLSGMILIPAI
ncbi:MAG: DUF3794 domain-containing protein [Oscillospiraceae bacterium]|nr:DUF3794 domain-containing protein [Oscillospiraceae bacterium]